MSSPPRVAQLSTLHGDDRAIPDVGTSGQEREGAVVRIVRRTVRVPEESHGEQRGGEREGRPEPTPR